MALDFLTNFYYVILCFVTFLAIAKKILGIKCNFLYLNFIFIFTLECFLYLSDFLYRKDFTGLYFLLDLLNVGYAYYFFTASFTQNKVLSYYGIVSICFILLSNNYSIIQYSDFCGIVSCFYVIIVCLYGFYLIVESDKYINQKIQNIPFFWYGTAMLLWCLMYLFRTIPRFYFQDEDKEFMQNLRIFFASVNVVVYAIFFKLILMYKPR